MSQLLRFLALACLLAMPAAAQDIPAFPGAYGFGSTTPGGRGGQVLFVTNLNDDGPGSLRAAVNTAGPRIIVFRVGGVIELNSTLEVSNPYVTIAGQTAPGNGITMKNFGMNVKTHDAVIRYIRVRPGDPMQRETDAIWVTRARNVVLDHVSTSWSIDETLSVTRSSDVTVQWSMITESLNDSYHSKGPHGYGSLISATDGSYTFHHNLYAHHRSRNPRPQGEAAPGLLLDFRNNVVYNWGDRAGYTSSREPQRLNFVNNYYKSGPSSDSGDRYYFFVMESNSSSVPAESAPLMFAQGNFMHGFPAGLDDNWLIVKGEVAHNKMASPFDAPAVPTTSAEEAYVQVLELAGAVLPRRDSVDARIADEVRGGTGSIVDSQTEVGGWPLHASDEPPADTDEDGMADSWELTYALDASNPTDNNADADADGYTNIEEYLNGTNPLVPENLDTSIDKPIASTLDGADLQVYPNPVRARATAEFTLEQTSDLTVTVVDLLGREVVRLAEGVYSPGLHRFEIDASRLTAGMYLVAVKSGGRNTVKKLVVLP